LLRRAIPLGALTLLVTAASLLGCAATEPPDSSEAREEDPATAESGEHAKQTVTRQEATVEVESSADSTKEEASGRLRCSEEEKKQREDLRLGDFEPPEYVPEYETVDEQPVDRYGAEAARLLVGHAGEERGGLRPHRPRYQVRLRGARRRQDGVSKLLRIASMVSSGGLSW
jgi:hypothetical protein